MAQANGDISDTDDSPLNTPLARMMARIVLPFGLLISLSHWLYAGSIPGDGFTAGVIGGLAVAVWYVVFGYDHAKQQLGWLRPWYLIGGGLTLALVNALLPLFFGREFFAITRIMGVDAPAGLHFTSTVIFEFAIFITILGSASLIAEAIAHPEGVEAIGTGSTMEVPAVQPDTPSANGPETAPSSASESDQSQQGVTDTP